MADSSVPITAGTGTNIDTRTTPGGDHRQVVALGNDGDVVAGIDLSGALNVFNGFATLFYDSWSGTIPDTIDKWTVDSRGTAPSVSGGNMTMPATLSSYNAVRTQDVVKPNAGFTHVRNGISIESATTTGAGRFWGLGTPATTPAAGVLVQDGIGFELDQATGNLLAVTYSAGVRTTVATLTRPADGATHAYGLSFRVTAAAWYIDDFQRPVAAVSFPTMTVVELPALIVRQNAASFSGGTPSFVNVAHLTADTSRQGVTLIDPKVGTRQARVTDPESSVTNAMGSSAATALATDSTTGAALNVNPNAIQKATYKVTAVRNPTANYVAGTTQWHAALFHPNTATKTVRIRRIIVATMMPATAESHRAELHWVSGTPTGTALAAGSATATAGYKPLDGRSPAGEATALSAPTITSAGVIATGFCGGSTAVLHGGGCVLYDWQESGETIPITLRAGVLEGIAVGVTSNAALTAASNTTQATVEITFTEE